MLRPSSQHSPKTMNPISSASISASNSQWDALKNKGKRLEKQLYEKLERFSSISCNSVSFENDLEDEQPLIREQFDDLSEDITKLLEKLYDLINEMREHIESHTGNGGRNRQHTLERYQSILKDYRSEFNRSSAKVTGHLTRSELFGSSGTRIANGRRGSFEQKSNVLLDEQSSLKVSLGLAEESLASVEESRENLRRQRTIFTASRNKAQSVMGYVPDLRDLMRKIQSYKKRDTIVMALTIAICMFFTLIYWWNK